jgi:hypothetical protein
MRLFILTAILILLILAPLSALAGHLHPEDYYQAQWCAEQNGTMEVTVESGARCDCLTATHAVEFDFASKWAEAIGQSLHYSAQTGKRAGIVLIMESPEKDVNYMERLKLTIEAHELPIDVWTVGE